MATFLDSLCSWLCHRAAAETCRPSVSTKEALFPFGLLGWNSPKAHWSGAEKSTPGRSPGRWFPLHTSGIRP